MIGYELKLTANLEISAYRGYLNAIRTEKKLLDSFRITLHYGNFGVLKFSPSDLKIENIKEVLKTNYYDESFDDEVETVKKLITDGVEQEWMVCDDISQAAKDIVYAMEGLKISSQTFGISENEIDREITYLLGLLGLEVE